MNRTETAEVPRRTTDCILFLLMLAEAAEGSRRTQAGAGKLMQVQSRDIVQVHCAGTPWVTVSSRTPGAAGSSAAQGRDGEARAGASSLLFPPEFVQAATSHPYVNQFQLTKPEVLNQERCASHTTFQPPRSLTTPLAETHHHQKRQNTRHPARNPKSTRNITPIHGPQDPKQSTRENDAESHFPYS